MDELVLDEDDIFRIATLGIGMDRVACLSKIHLVTARPPVGAARKEGKVLPGFSPVVCAAPVCGSAAHTAVLPSLTRMVSHKDSTATGRSHSQHGMPNSAGCRESKEHEAITVADEKTRTEKARHAGGQAYAPPKFLTRYPRRSPAPLRNGVGQSNKYNYNRTDRSEQGPHNTPPLPRLVHLCG